MALAGESRQSELLGRAGGEEGGGVGCWWVVAGGVGVCREGGLPGFVWN